MELLKIIGNVDVAAHAGNQPADTAIEASLLRYLMAKDLADHQLCRQYSEKLLRSTVIDK